MSGEENPGTESARTSMPDASRKRPGTEWTGILYMIVGLFILVAAFQLYFTVQDLIRTWVSDQFVPLVSALYYLAVIVVGVWLIRDYIRHQ